MCCQCKGYAVVPGGHYGGLGLEAWRQLTRRYMRSGGQYELDMMSRLMNPAKASKIADLPAAILRFERDLQTYEARTGRAFPTEWKAPTFLRILPDSHWEELVRPFQLGMRNYEDLVANVRGFSQEAWFSSKGPNDMDLDTAEFMKSDEGQNWEAVQKWIQTAPWDEVSGYWEQQQQQESLDNVGLIFNA